MTLIPKKISELSEAEAAALRQLTVVPNYRSALVKITMRNNSNSVPFSSEIIFNNSGRTVTLLDNNTLGPSIKTFTLKISGDDITGKTNISCLPAPESSATSVLGITRGGFSYTYENVFTLPIIQNNVLMTAWPTNSCFLWLYIDIFLE